MKLEQSTTMTMMALSVMLLLVAGLYIVIAPRFAEPESVSLPVFETRAQSRMLLQMPNARSFSSMNAKFAGQASFVMKPRASFASISPSKAASIDRPTDGTTAPEIDAATAPPPPSKPDSVRYITTAFYLNVRAEPNKHAQILDTVKKGTPLEVVSKTDNGWLQLKGEGYVHGAYARPDEPQAPALPQARHKKAVMIGADPQRLPFAVKTTNRLPGADRLSGPAGPSSEVISASGLTEDAIEIIFEGTELTGHGLEEAILELEREYGINAYFTIAVMKLESGNGKSRLSKVKNNLFGLNATGGSNDQAYAFETKADSVKKFGQLISKHYVGKGLETVEEVAKKYCPANPKWAALVKQIMSADHKKL